MVAGRPEGSRAPSANGLAGYSTSLRVVWYLKYWQIVSWVRDQACVFFGSPMMIHVEGEEAQDNKGQGEGEGLDIGGGGVDGQSTPFLKAWRKRGSRCRWCIGM